MHVCVFSRLRFWDVKGVWMKEGESVWSVSGCVYKCQGVVFKVPVDYFW